MRKLLQSFLVVAVLLIPVIAQAQVDTVSVRDFNTYENLTSEDEISQNPLTGQTVQFTAVVTSYPLSSGLASYNEAEDDIGRIHFFVTDTAAVTQGRDGMSIQIVESNLALIEDAGMTRGSVVEFVGSLTFFGSTAQVDLESLNILGTVASDYPEFAPLLEPWEITADELNIANGDGTYEVSLANYGKYNGAYVRLANSTVSNVSTGDRPNWAVNSGGSRVYVYDTSLRFRNDRPTYRTGYNWRHAEDGDFVPPVPGANVDLSGFVVLNGDDPDGNNAADKSTFNINPFEDGVVWLNDTRFVDGQDLGGGQTFEWPNDLVVNGLPPALSQLTQTPESGVTSSDQVVVTVNAVSQEQAGTVTGVSLFYQATGDASVTEVPMTNTSGDTYEATLPTFANFSSVSYYIEATGSNNLVGRFPISGTQNFFVADEAISSVEVLQKTADESTGASPLAGAGTIEMNISGLITSAVGTDGVVILQDNAAAWGGIFLEQTAETEALVRGDSITVTAGAVVEQEVNGSITLSQLTDLTFTVNSSGNDIEAVIPSVLTSDAVALEAAGEVEAFEGMVVKFENAFFVEEGSFGEWTIANTAPGADTIGVIMNEDIRSSAIGETNIPGDLSRFVRDDATFTAVYGLVAASFGSHKIMPRNLDDIQGTNWAIPNVQFDLLTPEDGATVAVTSDINVTWESTTDYDGDEVSYEWVLYAAADTSEIVAVPANNGGLDPNVTLPYATVDGLLSGAGLAVGETADFVWNVRAIDSSDTVGVAFGYDFDAQAFNFGYNTLTLERGVQTSNEDESGLPTEYTLKQNYPNPFNPTTQISFDLPAASEVRLDVYDMLGRRVATVVNERFTAGSHTVQFNANSLASGMYIYRINAGNFSFTRKMMLIK
ncbi:T9SS type A sorting domain-containing protein [Balneola sp. MJW-20]|uniref:T9SS type A sorting domain-containing protein n=1 Tax=Gracilimonas aurantiaca TaxID=3234185 RepID=UPI0034676112